MNYRTILCLFPMMLSLLFCGCQMLTDIGQTMGKELDAAGVVVHNAVAARNVVGAQPIGVDNVFPGDIDAIHIFFNTKGVVWSTPLRSIWTVTTAEGPRQVAEVNCVIPGTAQWGEMKAQRPTDGWPNGLYAVDFFVHDHKVGACSFSVTADGKSTRPPVLPPMVTAGSSQRSSNPPPPGKIESDAPVQVATGQIGSGGASLAVNVPGDQLDGMKITVPAGAYPNGQSIKVSRRRAEAKGYGPHVNLVSPLITVENGGQHAAKSMIVRVPVQVPPGHFAMPFYYDEQTGKLEGIPMIAADATSVTFLTRHFSSIVVSSIDQALLEQSLPVETGFKPGTDDWQFTNYGSYVAPHGHCAGQSISAMWYYYEKKLRGSRSLFGKYDNPGGAPTPDIWFDDPPGYKLASMVQKDMQWSTQYTDEAEAMAAASPDIVWGCFIYSMLVTGEPQFVGIVRFDDKGKAAGGHALIAYKADHSGLWIADPNLPGRKSAQRIIPRSPGKLGPYLSGETAKDIEEGNSRTYQQIGYFAKTALVPWSQVGQRWQDLADGTIGAGYFPEYDIMLVTKDGREIPFPDNYTTSEQELEVTIDGGAPPIAAPYTTFFFVYSFMDSKWMEIQGHKVHLRPGINMLGIEADAYWKDAEGKDQYSWAQFAWRTVNMFGLTVEPASQTGQTGSPFSFSAHYQGQVRNPRYEWLFGDDTNWTTSRDTGTSHVYRKKGKFEIIARLYDGDTNALIADGRANAVVVEEAATTTTVHKPPTPKPEDRPKQNSTASSWEKVFTGSIAATDFPRSSLPPGQRNQVAWESLLRPTIKERTTKIHRLAIPQAGRITMTVKVTGKFDHANADSPDRVFGNGAGFNWHDPTCNGSTYYPEVQPGTLVFTVFPSQERKTDLIRVLPCSYEIRVKWAPR